MKINKLGFSGPKTLSKTSRMPKIGSQSIAAWQDSLFLVTTIQTMVEGDPVVTEKKELFKGTIQPLSVKAIELKPEGQRAWAWYQIHTMAGDLNLDTDDIVMFNDIKYKIMKLNDYNLNDYMEYHAIRDYE